GRDKKSGGNGNTVKESMNHQAQQHRVGAMRMRKLMLVRLFPKVEVGSEGVLEEVHQEVSRQNIQRRMRGIAPPALGRHFDQSHRQHEPRAQGHKIAQITPLPIAMNNNRAAKSIGSSSGEAEKERESKKI